MSANLPKLLRTLSRYEADLLILPVGNLARVLVNGNWKIIEDHPEIQNSELLEHLKEILGEKILEDLENGLEVAYEYKTDRFVLSMRENSRGKILTAQRLKTPIQDLTAHKGFPVIQNWLRRGRGILRVKDQALYASILKHYSQHKNDTAISLERSIKYPARSFIGLVEQRELGEHFTSPEEGIRDALQIKASLLAVNELPMKQSEFVLLEKFAEKNPVLLLPDYFSDCCQTSDTI
ncbi:hypothetical protein HY463_01305 [Candidatus Peregrinibacteria bacterium]|nr:hypothetical protein [Candidatus Peregrinibacteria bacterium]